MSEVDTTQGIWENKYFVKLPALGATSVSFLKMHGSYVTGDRAVDAGSRNNWILTYLSIDRMVDYFKEGVVIAVVNPSDTKLIYDAIDRHLTAWVDQLHYGLNNGNAPLEDLIAMDEFAQVVYPHAKRHFSGDMFENVLLRNLEGRFAINSNNFLRKLKPAIAEPEPEVERTPFSDFLKSRIRHNGV